MWNRAAFKAPCSSVPFHFLCLTGSRDYGSRDESGETACPVNVVYQNVDIYLNDPDIIIQMQSLLRSFLTSPLLWFLPQVARWTTPTTTPFLSRAWEKRSQLRKSATSSSRLVSSRYLQSFWLRFDMTQYHTLSLQSPLIYYLNQLINVFPNSSTGCRN